MIALLVGLALSTLISEDLASIGAGLLAREGRIPLAYAVVACSAGVYAGDLALWAMGWLCGRHTSRFTWLRRVIDSTRDVEVSSQIEKRLGISILVSRFVPGTRLPMYVALGVWGRRPLAFAAWSLIAVIAWTPLLVVTTARLGDAVMMHAITGIRTGALASLLTTAVTWGLTRLAGRSVARLADRYHQRRAHTIDMPT